MYQLTNVPTAVSRNQIKARVDGSDISIRCVEEAGTMGVSMTSIHIGDHMLTKPEALREMVGKEICDAIRLARDAGYRQGIAAIRRVLELES